VRARGAVGSISGIPVESERAETGMRIGSEGGGVKTLGVIGGSGLYDLAGLERSSTSRRIRLSSGVRRVRVRAARQVRLVFLPRHGRGHRLMPTEINYRANIFGMKALAWIGC